MPGWRAIIVVDDPGVEATLAPAGVVEVVSVGGDLPAAEIAAEVRRLEALDRL